MKTENERQPAQGSATTAPRGVRGLTFTLAAVTLCLVSALAATGLARLLRPPQGTEAEPPPPQAQKPDVPARLFRDWDKPDLAVVLSAQQHGYLLPCGCSRPQMGGLERRYNFMQRLRAADWPVAAVDLGDIPQREGPAKLPNVQGLLKYRFSMDSLRTMGYLSTGIGEYEVSQSLFHTLGEYALNAESPRVLAATLLETDKLFPGMTQPWEVYPNKHAGKDLPCKVGVVSIISKSVQKTLRDPALKFDDNREVIRRALADPQMAAAPVRILLFQGSVEEAKLCARDYPQFGIVLCLSAEDEPSSEPIVVGDSLVVAVGHKGRYIGVVGLWKTRNPAKPWAMKYQLVGLGEDFMTPEKDFEKHPIMKLMEEYGETLKKENYLGKYGQVKHPLQLAVPGEVPTYVGSKKCQECHEHAYEVWAKSKHSHAYQTLVDAKHPSNRHLDAECITCHVVGFGYESGFTSEKVTPKLKDVGCESCHGPASKHVAAPNDVKWQKLMNEWKAPENENAKQKAERMGRIDRMCQRCHDIDNDVKYKFETRWPEIDHPTPK